MGSSVGLCAVLELWITFRQKMCTANTTPRNFFVSWGYVAQEIYAAFWSAILFAWYLCKLKPQDIIQRYLWKGRIRKGKRAEYIERHDQIWPEMTQMLNEAGTRNYSIRLIGNELIGYYECEGVAFANRYQAESLINPKWDAFMADVMYIEVDPKTGNEWLCQEVFYHS